MIEGDHHEAKSEAVFSGIQGKSSPGGNQGGGNPGAAVGARYSIHPNQIAKWKKEALSGLAEVFANKEISRRKNSDAEIKDLHAKIGQLTAERDFLARAFGR